MTVNHTIEKRSIEKLRTQLKGVLALPEDPQYNKVSQPWNLNVQQRPALVVVAASTSDMQTAVRFASDQGMGVGVMATGHGVGRPCNGGLLINTSKLRSVTVDPASQEATVEAGALWEDVIPKAYAHDLATLAGSAPHVGVVGYTLGGGFGYLGRKYGLNSASVTGAEVITADGKLLKVNTEENSDLFWSLKGGGGNFGVVTSLKFRLYPVTTVYGGAVFYPIEHGHEALTFFAKWTKEIPDEITAAIAFMNIPPLPAVPEVLRGRSVVVIKGCYCGEKPERGEELFASARSLGKPIADTFGIMPVTAMDAISKDPVDPVGVLQFGGMVTELSAKAIDAFVKVAGVGSGSPLLAVEFRSLGAALSRRRDDINLMGHAQYSLNAIGAAFNPSMTAKAQSHLTLLSEVTAPYQTGEVFLNFMEVDPAQTRVRAAYTTEDWKRLIELKHKYDPKNIFRFNRNIQ